MNKQKCKECQFENGEHGQMCSFYNEWEPTPPTSTWEKRFEGLSFAIKYIKDGEKIIDFDYLKPFEKRVKSFIRTEINTSRKETIREIREEIWEAMMDSMPKDAENLSTLTDWQASAVLKGVQKYLHELDKTN